MLLGVPSGFHARPASTRGETPRRFPASWPEPPYVIQTALCGRQPMAHAASPGGGRSTAASFNPLFLCGGVGPW